MSDFLLTNITNTPRSRRAGNCLVPYSPSKSPDSSLSSIHSTDAEGARASVIKQVQMYEGIGSSPSPAPMAQLVDTGESVVELEEAVKEENDKAMARVETENDSDREDWLDRVCVAYRMQYPDSPLGIPWSHSSCLKEACSGAASRTGRTSTLANQAHQARPDGRPGNGCDQMPRWADHHDSPRTARTPCFWEARSG